jgi:hypothetical protein
MNKIKILSKKAGVKKSLIFSVVTMMVLVGIASSAACLDPKIEGGTTLDDFAIDWPKVRLNMPPQTPVITGEEELKTRGEYEYGFVSVDPNEDDISYYIDWGDEMPIEWSTWYQSGEEVTLTHLWDEQGTYTVRAKAKDICGAESEWSDPLVVTMSKTKQVINPSILDIFLECFPLLARLLNL